MPALTPQFLVDLETQIASTTEDEYSRLASNLWWSRIMKSRPSQSRKEIVHWLLTTAQIEDLGKLGGNMPFADLESMYTEFESRHAGQGLRLRKDQIEDTDGQGVDMAAKWSGDIGKYMAYWPQKQLVKLLKQAESLSSYDGVPFFAKNHPLNPYSGTATFANLFAGAASSTPSTDPNDSTYPGACPIHDANAGAGSVTVDVAIQNVEKVFSYIRSIRMPNGEDPRGLRGVAIAGAPAIAGRVAQLTNAKFLAQAAAGGAATADVEALIKSLGLAEGFVMDEFAGVDNTSWYVIAEEMGKSELGGFVYVDRESFKINFYGEMDDAEIGRSEILEWHCKGRNAVGFGHPYTIFKVKAS